MLREWSIKPPLMDPSSTCGRSPKLTVCPCLSRWVWSRKSCRCPLFGQDLTTWGALGCPAAPPNARGPGRAQKKRRCGFFFMLPGGLWLNDEQKEATKKTRDLDTSCERVPAQVCVRSSLPPRRPQGQGPALLALRRSRLGNTLHTPYTHSSTLAGTAVGETPPEEKKERRLHRLFKCIKPARLVLCTVVRQIFYLSSFALYLEHSRRDFAALHQLSHVCWCVVGYSYGLQPPLGMQLLQCSPALSSVAWD